MAPEQRRAQRCEHRAFVTAFVSPHGTGTPQELGYSNGVTFADATQTSTLAEDDGRAPNRWWLVLAHHDDPAVIGRRIALDDAVQLGRKSSVFGSGVLDDGHISRAHAEFDRASGGVPLVRDLDSRNGTFVNGVRVQEQPLVAGDVVGMGRALLLVIREPVAPSPPPSPSLVGTSFALAAARCTIAKAATRGPTLLWGESGSGKDALARDLHELSERNGPLEFVRCGRQSDQELLAVLEAAQGGTVVLDTIEELPPSGQLLLFDQLETGRLRETGVVACTVESPDALAHRLRPELLHRIRRWSIRVPSLTERRADIPLLALAFARRYSDTQTVRLDAELTFRLLRHRWPGNLHELEAIVERAAVESPNDRLAPFDGLDALLAQHASAKGISTYGRKVEREPFVADARGRWYTTPDGHRFDLERRKTLARVLATMLDARRDDPGRALSVSDMLDRAWAEEKLLPRAGANRVYVAMTTLRKMGLRSLLVRTDAGYVLDPDVPLRVIDE